jgi:hypothetical protein
MKRAFAFATAVALLLSLAIAGTIRISASPTPTEPGASTCAIPPGTLAMTTCGTPFVDQTHPTVSRTNFPARISGLQMRGGNVVRVNLHEERPRSTTLKLPPTTIATSRKH